MTAPLRLLVAPDKFKGSLTAPGAARAMARGAQRAAAEAGLRAEVQLLPVADGGEGTVDAIIAALDGDPASASVPGPVGEPVAARWGMVELEGERVGIIEMAAAAGFSLVPPARRNPGRTTTRGVGRLILAAAKAGCDRIVVGLGGSATCDAGVGMAAELGVRFLDGAGRPVEPIGDELERIEEVDVSGLDPRVARLVEVRGITAACDVDNPLFGPTGSAYVYAPQKGADAEQVRRLDAGLRNLADRCAEAELPGDAAAPGAGSAGGFGYGLAAFLDAEIRPGAPFVLDLLNFAEHVEAYRGGAVITGEGRLDRQSLSGKAAQSVARVAAEQGVPVLMVVGSAEPGVAAAFERAGLALAQISTAEEAAGSAEAAIARGAAAVEEAARRGVERFIASLRIGDAGAPGTA